METLGQIFLPNATIVASCRECHMTIAEFGGARPERESPYSVESIFRPRMEIISVARKKRRQKVAGS